MNTSGIFIWANFENFLFIMKDKSDKPGIPRISVLVMTYMHGKFLKQTLDGIMMQKTAYPFEVLIHDDASSDQTPQIIANYISKYPDVIKALIQPVNTYNLPPNPRFHRQKLFEQIKGKYIAICEGDDYWIDPNKLQLQYEFMEKNKDCNLCFHAVYYTKPGENTLGKIVSPIDEDISSNMKFTVVDVINRGGEFVSSNSMFFRTDVFVKRPDWVDNAPVWDFPLTLYLASNSNIGYINKPMGVYRVNSGPNSWSQSMQNRALRKKHFIGLFRMLNSFNQWSDYQYDSFIRRKKRWYYISSIKKDFKFFLKTLFRM